MFPKRHAPPIQALPAGTTARDHVIASWRELFLAGRADASEAPPGAPLATLSSIIDLAAVLTAERVTTPSPPAAMHRSGATLARPRLGLAISRVEVGFESLAVLAAALIAMRPWQIQLHHPHRLARGERTTALAARLAVPATGTRPPDLGPCRVSLHLLHNALGKAARLVVVHHHPPRRLATHPHRT